MKGQEATKPQMFDAHLHKAELGSTLSHHLMDTVSHDTSKRGMTCGTSKMNDL